MHPISRKTLRVFWEVHPDARAPLSQWFKVVEKAEWRNFSDVRPTYGSADVVDRFVVFNVGGNKVRVVVEILFEQQVVLIRHVLTHAEYDRGAWKRSRAAMVRGHWSSTACAPSPSAARIHPR